MNKIYDVSHYIAKFSDISEDKWITNKLYNASNDNECCSQGHCIPKNLLNIGYKLWDEDFAKNTIPELYNLAKLFSTDYLTGAEKVASINNGVNLDYQQETPKQRILAALYDLKALETPEITKTEVVEKPKYRLVKVNFDILEPALN